MRVRFALQWWDFMKHAYTHTAMKAVSVAAMLGLLLSHTPVALAASSWSPGLLVNTESFQTIDDGDSTTDIELRFGGTLNEKIFWDYETSRFEFTDDVHVQGNLTATGTIIADGAISTKANLTINSDQTAADAVLTFGQPSTNETLTFSNSAGRFDFSDDVYVQNTLEVDGNAQFDGGTLTIGDAGGDAVTVNSSTWTFANDTSVALTGGVNGINFDSNTLSIDATANRVGIGTAAPAYELDTVGSIHASTGLSSSGTLVWEGAASGASLWVSQFKGPGLVSTCDSTTGKLTWDATTQRFVCGTDSGTTYSAGQGLTLTSTVFSLSPSFSGTALEILGTASGRILHANDKIQSSGSLILDGSASIKTNLTINSDNGGADAILTFGNDGGAETLRFNDTTNNFAISDDIDVTGNVDATGTVSGDGNFTINEDNTGADAILTFGNDGGVETIRFNDTTNNFSFSDDLDVTGTVNTTGNITTDANLTINEDNGDSAAVLTFGNDADTASLTFSNDANPRFVFDDDVKATGYLSGSTLTVDGTITIRGQAMTFPGNAGVSGAVLRTNGAGVLSWSTGINEGSGDILSIHPEYPNAIYYQSGSTYIGQLVGSGGLNSGFENTYQWSSTKSAIQDYWVSTRVRIPDNFVRWDPVKALQLRYRTKTGTTSQNHITVKLLDTTGAAVALTGGATLANTSFTTANITGPQGAGTYTPGGFITILVKLAANSSGQANAGFITLNWETKNP